MQRSPRTTQLLNPITEMTTNNLSKIRSTASELNIDAVVINNTHNVRYAAGYAADYAYVVITRDRAFYLTDGRFTIEASEKLGNDFEIIKIGSTDLRGKLLKCLQDVSSVGYETSVTYSDCIALLDILKDYTVCNITADLAKLRAVKTADEIECIIKANAIAEKALHELKYYMRAGVTERELQVRLDFLMGMYGSEKVSFDTIVAFGENSAHAHAKPSDRQLKNGDIMLFDYGATYNGYHSDMTRCFIFGSASNEQINVYNAVHEAQITALNELSAGKSCAEIDGSARNVLTRLGFGEYFTHSLGHGVGLEIHESPSLNTVNNSILTNGMVVTVEPGVYIKGLGGIRIEDMAVVGGQNITTFPKELVIIADAQ